MIKATLISLMIAGPGAVWAAGSDLSSDTSARPVLRPDTSATPSTDQADEAEAAKPVVPAVPSEGMRDLLRQTDQEYVACLGKLNELGVIYTETDPIIPEDDADCGILRPLKVTEIAPGVAISPAATMRCPAIQALAIWTRDFVLPSAKRVADRGDLVAIQNGSGYICRRRNNAPDGKLSEHAFGNAFDVMGFTFADGPPIAIEPREAQGTMAEAFQDAVRASACLDFSTVLGPGSNASHADHLHLDVIARSGGYRLCEQGGETP